MLSEKDIGLAQFSKSRNGYDRDEVDTFLDLIEKDYALFEKETSTLREQISKLTKENEEIKVSQSSIQTLLVSTQRLADEITDTAKVEARRIIDEANNQAAAIAHQADTQRIAAEQAANQLINEAVKKSESMITAAHDSVARQQILFDDLKAQISDFKNDIKQKYKEHIELLAQIPDSVSNTATESAAAVKQMIEETDTEKSVVDTTDIMTEQEAPVEDEQEDTGFKVTIGQEEEPAETEIEEEPEKKAKGSFKTDFFKRK